MGRNEISRGEKFGVIKRRSQAIYFIRVTEKK